MRTEDRGSTSGVTGTKIEGLKPKFREEQGVGDPKRRLCQRLSSSQQCPTTREAFSELLAECSDFKQTIPQILLIQITN